MVDKLASAGLCDAFLDTGYKAGLTINYLTGSTLIDDWKNLKRKLATDGHG